MAVIVLQTLSRIGKAGWKAIRKGIQIAAKLQDPAIKTKAMHKKDLQKAIWARTNPLEHAKSLTKEQRYRKAIEDSYKKQGGTMKYKTGGMANPNKKATVNPKGPKGKMGYGMKMGTVKKMGKKK